MDDNDWSGVMKLNSDICC